MAISGAELREARQRMGLTQEELGRQIGTYGAQVSNWERGKQKIKPDWLEKLKRVLDIRERTIQLQDTARLTRARMTSSELPVEPRWSPEFNGSTTIPYPDERPFIPLWPDAARWLCIETQVEAEALVVNGDFPIKYVELGPDRILVATADLRTAAGLPLSREAGEPPSEQ